jgi:hypothetical protein
MGARQLGATEEEIREVIGVAEVIAIGSVRSLAIGIEANENNR